MSAPLDATAADWPELKRLAAAPHQPPPFDLSLLPEGMRAWVADEASRLAVPPEAVAVPALVAAGSLIGNSRRLYVKAVDKSWAEPAILWGVIIASPSMKKSPALRAGLRYIKALEREEAAAYRKREEAAKPQLKALEVQIRGVSKSLEKAEASGNDADAKAHKSRLQALYEEQEGLVQTPRRLIINDVTPEMAGQLLQQNPNGLLYSRDELEGFLKSLEKQNYENARTMYLEAYSGVDSYGQERLSRAVHIETAALSIIGGIQPGVFQRHLDTVLKTDGGDGFFARMQLTVWIESQNLGLGSDTPPDQLAAERAETIHRNLRDEAQRISEGLGPGAFEGISFAHDAQEHFDSWRRELNSYRHTAIVQERPAYDAYIGKLEATAVRLALILHCVDHADGKPTPSVTLDQVIRAIGLATYFLEHAKRTYRVPESTHWRGAMALAEKILKRDLKDQTTLRDLQASTSLFKKAADLRDALAVLEEHNWARLTLRRNPGAPPSEVIELNPALLQANADSTNTANQPS